ncbi:MAG: SpaA isopeptide-forming pilin-related protein [Planctomycetia bacterium]|nr:SpaA isopeptide-forming pilin-related protein [Planctomycetia bacterium]
MKLTLDFKTWCRRTMGVKAARGKQRTTLLLPAIVESLEPRSLLTATIVVASTIESFDGTGNNLKHPNWGSDGVDLLRKSVAAYADGISTPGGATRPSAREISNAISDQPAQTASDRDLSNFIYAWGQFIDHDLDLTTSASPRESFNIAVPTGDPQFDPLSTGTQIIPLSRSKYDPVTGTSTTNPRQQVNIITAWVDGSMVYGSDATRAAALRTFSGGMLKTSDGNLLPSNTAGLANANDTHQTPDDQLFLAGDVRANENIELTSLHVLFVREHNRIAEDIASHNPSLSDEAVYQQARRRVIAEIQAITYNEFLPALLGTTAIPQYRGYNQNVNPGIANEFSTAAFRVGHTMVGDDVEFLDDQGNEVRDELPLSEAFFNPNVLRETGVDPILKYLASDHAEEIDTQVVESLRNFLFGSPGAGGFDLPALNIQRGRDHGLADYNSVRAAYGLPRVQSFAQITSDVALQQSLKSLYGNVNNIDLWVGGLAENHLTGSSVGPTFSRIIADQFARLRDGDRFWYQNLFQGRELNEIQNTHLSEVIRRNTNLTNIQTNVFLYQATISGRVFGDGNRDGVANPREVGIAGRMIQLLDADNNIVATTVTDRNGQYRFEHLSLGTYQVNEVLPAGAINTTPPPQPIAITRGMKVDRIDFGEAPALGNKLQSPRPSIQSLLAGFGLSR